MAWRIHDHVTHGEIDNRENGTVEGRLWLAGRTEPIILRLNGNCWSDLAGCMLTFRNPSPDKTTGMHLADLQEGVVGDMTASRKVRVPTVDDEELARLIEQHEPIPTKLGNSLYLEWFSGANGRVVLEATHYHCELSMPVWSMTPGQQKAQQERNDENLKKFLQDLVNHQSCIDALGDAEEEKPLDEFEWEQLLRQSDNITDKYLEALEKFRDDPDCERRVAEAMGWDWLIEEGDLPDDNPLFDLVNEATGDLIKRHGGKSDPELDDPEHPLVRRACELAARIYAAVEERGLLQNQDVTLLSLLTCSNATASKIGYALNSLISNGETIDYGFVIASLKRSLVPLHQAISAANRLAERIPEESKWLKDGCAELFMIRQEILSLMQEFRKEL